MQLHDLDHLCYVHCKYFEWQNYSCCLWWQKIRVYIFQFLRVIKSLAKWNGKEIPVSMLTNLLNKHQNDDEQEKSEEKSMTVLDLFKTKKLRIKTCILSCKYSWIFKTQHNTNNEQSILFSDLDSLFSPILCSPFGSVRAR